MQLCKLTHSDLAPCVDLYIDVFSRPPWNDVYESRNQVVQFFQNHLNNNYFIGFVLKHKQEIIALCLGSKKPWINGLEYYIDELCLKSSLHRQGIGSHFLSLIESSIKSEGLNAIILNTHKNHPAYHFYIKNHFFPFNHLAILTKELSPIKT